MTTSTAFTPEEWHLILEGPPTAGLIVMTAQHGGMVRETIAMSKAYVETRSQHAKTELLAEIVAHRPERDHTRYHSHEELDKAGLQHLRDAVALLQSKATPDEVEGYRRFTLDLVNRVATAHREGAQAVTPAEQNAVQAIADALGATSN